MAGPVIENTSVPRDRSRHQSPYPLSQKLARVLWTTCQATLFRWSPRPLYGWRVLLLRLFGADVSSSARVHPSVRIEQPWNLSVGANAAVGDAAILYALGEIRVGDRVTVSQRAHLCAGTHDYRLPDMPLVRMKVVIGDDAWIAAEAYVGPGVRVGEGAILGARGVAVRSLQPWSVYVGNPSVCVKNREPLEQRSQDGRPAS